LSEESISEFSKIAYAKPNIAVVANGADQASLSKWVGQFFSSTSSTYPHADVVKSKFDAATKYYGGETRIASTASKQAYVIAFPGSSSFTAGSSYKPELAVLATLLGGQSTIKWSPGFSLLGQVATSSNASINTTHSAYSDAGLLSINLAGSSASIRKALPEVVKVLKSISEGSVPKEAFTKAVANAKFNAIEEGMNLDAGLVATGSGLILGGKAFQIDEVTKAIESVSQEKLQAVSSPHTLLQVYIMLIFPRLLRVFLRVRQVLRLLVTSMLCHSPRRLVSGFRGFFCFGAV
jgi:ubiquinol-cytochrome c reductase core subunit 2